MKKRLNSNFAYMNTKPSSLALLTLMLLLLLVQSALAQSDAICNPLDGDIDDDNDRLIEICHLEDLDAIRYQLDGTGYTASTGAMKITTGCPDAGCNGYELSRDLDFLEDASYRDAAANKAAYTQGTGWQPIGRYSVSFRITAPFRATFNGNRYTLSNLRIDRPDIDQVALFGDVDGGRIINVALLNVQIRGLYWVGGLVGRMASSHITGSYATGGSVEGTNQQGFSLGGVGALIGGIFGKNNTISGNYANLRVTAHFASSGLIGFISGSASGNLTISNNYADGSIVGDTFVGGFIAFINERNLIISSSSNYASGVVTGRQNVGGFVGGFDDRGQTLHFTDNYWDSERSRQRSSVGEEVGQISSLTTVQMTAPTAPGTTVTEAYHNWSEAYWDFGSRYDYPVLRHTTANSALGQKVGDLLGHQRPQLSRLLLGIGSRTLPLAVEQTAHRRSVDFDTEQISLSAETDDAEAILHINGTTATSGEMRSFDLPVAQTTTLTLTLSQPYYVWPRVYALEVYRKANAELSELNVSAGQLMPSFNPQTTFYTLSVSATTETLIVTPVAADPKARIEVDGGVAGREIALREGTTTISILVAARDRIAQTTYTLAVWRPTSDARLQALSVPNGVLHPEFTPEQTTYTAAVFAERIQLVARAPRGATIEVNGVPVASRQPSEPIEVLRDIPTRIVVMVTAVDGVTTKRYVVWATRRIGTEARLATLILPNIALTPPFNPDSEQRTYTATVIGISEVALTASAALGGRLEEVEVNGTPIEAKPNGDYTISLPRMGAQATTTHIVITVESEDQSTQTHYRVAIQRQPSSDAQLTALSLIDSTQAVPLSPSFSSTRTAYTATVVGTRTITLTAAASRHAKFTVNGVATASGQPSPIALSPSTTTNITLIVTAEDATTTMSYTVAVAHQPSPEAQLTALSLSDGTQAVPLSPPFSATQTTYTATLAGQISAITLIATASRYATLTVNGVPTASGQPSLPIALSPSTTTTITLIVSAEDATTTTAYTLQIITTARPTAALRVRSRIFLEAPLP